MIYFFCLFLEQKHDLELKKNKTDLIPYAMSFSDFLSVSVCSAVLVGLPLHYIFFKHILKVEGKAVRSEGNQA